jgi:phosphocarrier protein
LVEREFVVRNKLGLHARPAALFVQMASRFRAEIRVSKGDTEVNGKSVMGLMMLAAEKGSKVRVVADGPDEAQAVKELGHLFRTRFDEE